jgi:hypothetical protein
MMRLQLRRTKRSCVEATQPVDDQVFQGVTTHAKGTSVVSSWQANGPRDGKRRVATRALSVMLVAAALAGLVPLYWSIALAIGDATVHIDRVAGDGWVASGVVFEVDLSVEPATARMQAESVQFSVLGTQASRMVRAVKVDCAQFDVRATVIDCSSARIRGAFPSIGTQALTGSVRFDRRTQALALTLANLELGSGVARVSGNWSSDGWSAQMTLQKGKLAALQALLKDWTSAPLPLSVSGELDVELQMQGRAARLDRASWRLQARQLTLGNETGTLAAEQLVFDSQGSVERIARARSAPTWRFVTALNSNSGQGYFEPVFLNFGDHPLTLGLEGDWISSSKTLALRKLSIAQRAALAASGHGAVTFEAAPKITRLHLDIQRAEFPGAYALYMQPFLLSTALGSLTTRGAVSGSLDVVDNLPAVLALDLRAVSAEDAQQRLAIAGLSGEVRWRKERTRAPPASQLRWQGVRVLGIEIGAAEVQFLALDRDFRLTRGVQIPLLDGSIELAELQVAAAGQPNMTLQMDASLRPVSVQRLCTVFGWPQFGGRISGRLADLQLRNGVVTLGTVLTAEVFDGRVRVADLRLEQVFSKWPRFSASIAIEELDLEQVTSAFSFGLITGRLSGAIDDLRLFNWSPVSFDASLYTTPGDRSKHRISQRAVNSIGSLGGSASGAAAALSTGVLKFFENFSYERLGLSCKLENEICAMNGVEPAKNGYYLVKGRGIPRIDVIGNAARVDWPRLVEQLQAATELQSPQLDAK